MAAIVDDLKQKNQQGGKTVSAGFYERRAGYYVLLDLRTRTTCKTSKVSLYWTAAGCTSSSPQHTQVSTFAAAHSDGVYARALDQCVGKGECVKTEPCLHMCLMSRCQPRSFFEIPSMVHYIPGTGEGLHIFSSGPLPLDNSSSLVVKAEATWKSKKARLKKR